MLGGRELLRPESLFERPGGLFPKARGFKVHACIWSDKAHGRGTQHLGSPPLHIRRGRRVPTPNLKAIRAIRAEIQEAKGSKLSPSVSKFDIWDEKAVSHTSGIAILFLGTGVGSPAEQRRAGTVALKLTKSTWLFDAGEDTQRQVHKQPLVKHGKVDRIFITNRRSSNILGLPGLLCTMSGARSIGLDVSDVPLHIYGPPGLSEFIRPMLHLSDTYIAMPVIVHELVEHAVDPDLANKPQLLDKRSCLYRVLVPPDKLNPQGYSTVFLERMLDRGSMSTRGAGKKEDERVNHRPLQLPPPGTPEASISGPEELTWTFHCERERSVTARRVPAGIESYAYIINEASRIGKLNVAAAEKYGIYGFKRNDIKSGLSVKTDDGEIVHPDQICGPDIVGRSMVVVGESTDSSVLAQHCQGADALIHAACCHVTSQDGSPQVNSTIDQASLLATACEARHLLLYRFQPGDKAQEENSNGTAAEPSASDPGKQDTAFGLNLVNSYNHSRRGASQGYLWRADNAWHPYPSPPQTRHAAELYIKAQLGQEQGLSIPDDMDCFVVDRRDALTTPIADEQHS